MKKSILLKMTAVLAAAIVFSLALNYLVEYHNVKQDFLQESHRVFAQMKSLVEQNVSEAEKTREDYNQICLTKAHIAAYILSDPEQVPDDMASWKYLVKLLDVDEIHLFNTEGVIVNGSEPKYYGYAFSSGKQMGYFLPMLEDKTLALCQGVEPNTAESKSMQYAATWNEAGTLIVEIGMEPTRVLEALENVTFSRIFSLLIEDRSHSLYAFDRDSHEIIGSMEDSDLGRSADDIGFHPDSEPGQVIKEIVNGSSRFVVYEALGDIVLARTMSARNIHTALTRESALIALYVMLVAALAIFVIMQLLERNIIRGIQRINKGLLSITDGDLDVKMTENSVPELNEMCGHINEMIESLLDMSRTRAQLAHAQELTKAKSEFLSRMSHDIRTPVNGIIGMLYILERNLDDPKVKKDSVEKLKTSSTQLQLLVNDALDMSRLERGAVKLTADSFCPEETLDHCIHSMQVLADQGAVTITKDFSEMQHRHFIGSPLHVQRIAMNLISNAVKYNRPGGYVHVTLREEHPEPTQSRLCFIVADNGIGISKDFLPLIFTPFERETNAKSATVTGTGLGMTITKELVELMHGDIHVESREGTGTTITVRLPLQPDPGHEHISHKEQVVKSIKGKRILLAEDNALNRNIALYILNEAGAVVTPVENGKLAVSAFAENEYDLVLMDLIMPVMNGHEAARTIRSLDRPNAKTVPIIAMTANAFEEDIQACKVSGMNDHIAKPIDMDVMMGKISKYL